MSTTQCPTELRPASFASMSSAPTQSYRQAVLRAGLGRCFFGMFLSWLMASTGICQFRHSGLHLLFEHRCAGRHNDPEYYLQLMTMHGTIMVFFVLTPPRSPRSAILFAHPNRRETCFRIQHDVVLGHLRGFLPIVARFLSVMGPPGGWTQYAPLSAIVPLAVPARVGA